jgi:hypothetical protein
MSDSICDYCKHSKKLLDEIPCNSCNSENNYCEFVGIGIKQIPQESLRDQFAMAALPEAYRMWGTQSSLQDIADLCYVLASAMLKAREKDNE